MQDRTIEVVAGVIIKDGKIILAQRKKGDPLEGLWEFPGGKLERGETPEKALVREIKEELGIRVSPVKKLLEISHLYPDKRVHLHFVLATTREAPKALDCQQVKEVEPENVEKFPLAPADRRAWQKLKAMVKTWQEA